VILASRAGGYKNIDFFYGTAHGLSIGSPRALIAYLIVILVPALANVHSATISVG
jgi:hypothetical protein